MTKFLMNFAAERNFHATLYSDGADYIVIGRPIRNVGDPEAKAERIVEDIQAAMDDR